MLPSAIPPSILIAPIILSLVTAVPLLDTHNTHHQAIEQVHPSPVFDPFAPNNNVHGVPDDLFLPSPTDGPLDFNVSDNFGLWRSGFTKPLQTVWLHRGEAKFQATFTLLLHEAEHLKGMRHRQNDSSIITSFEQSRERVANNYEAYNISITHHFRGTVGIAEYELKIFTTLGATLRITGLYYVAGVVFYGSTDSEPRRIVSGSAVTAPLSAETIFSFSNSMKQGRLMLPMKYQDIGSDVAARTSTIQEILSTAQITSTSSNNMSLFSKDNLKCSKMYMNVSVRHKSATYPENCDINFEIDSLSLVLRLHPERYGKVAINIVFPAMLTNMEKPFETDIIFEILKPAVRRPEFVIRQDTYLELDYYGMESFSIQMKNPPNRDNRRDVLTYVIDLSDGRYAVANFPNSSLSGALQNVSFDVLAPGQENPEFQDKIRQALMDLRDSKEEKLHREDTLVEIRYSDRQTIGTTNIDHAHSMTNVTRFDISAFASYDAQYSENFDIISSGRLQKGSYRYRSHVHALYPGFDALVTAKGSSSSTLWTKLSTRKLATVDSLQVTTDRQNVLVKITLLRYTLQTFSQHKSIQIGMYLSKEVSRLCRSSIQRASLVMLEDKGLNIAATYHVLVPKKHENIVTELETYTSRTGARIAKEVLLREGQLKITNIHKLPVLGKAAGTNVTVSEPSTRYKGLNGTLLAVIVVAIVVIAIPVLLIFLGFCVARRSREEGSDLDNNPTGSSSHREGNVHKTTGDSKVAADVLRDNYGRADEEAHESFKVKTEMIKEGYFGGKEASKENGSASLAKP